MPVSYPPYKKSFGDLVQILYQIALNHLKLSNWRGTSFDVSCDGDECVVQGKQHNIN
jgi:hypothetical protein